MMQNYSKITGFLKNNLWGTAVLASAIVAGGMLYGSNNLIQEQQLGMNNQGQQQTAVVKHNQNGGTELLSKSVHDSFVADVYPANGSIVTKVVILGPGTIQQLKPTLEDLQRAIKNKDIEQQVDAVERIYTFHERSYSSDFDKQTEAERTVFNELENLVDTMKNVISKGSSASPEDIKTIGGTAEHLIGVINGAVEAQEQEQSQENLTANAKQRQRVMP